MPSGVCYQFRDTGTCRFGSGCKFLHIQHNSHPTSKRSRRRGEKCQSKTGTYIEDFFQQYRQFDYDSSSPVMQEFYRMCGFFGWEKDDPERLDARENLKDAMTLQFNAIFGEDENDLESWQNLCGACDVNNIPDDLEECRDLVKSLHVNLVDLVDSYDNHATVQLFDSEAALSEYTKQTDNYFPKENAYAGGLLRFLLRHITNPYPPSMSARGRRHRRF